MPDLQIIARAVHLIGVVLWIGGIAAAAVVAAGLRGEGAAGRAVRRAILVVATPGLLLAWAGGLTMLIPHFSELYMRAGWMHGKLTVAVIATAITGVVTGRVRKVARDEAIASPGLMWTLGILLLLLGAAAIGLAVLRPGA